MPRYLVSWLSIDGPRVDHGNSDLTLPQPITDMDDVKSVERLIRVEFGIRQPVLMGFSRFEENR